MFSKSLFKKTVKDNSKLFIIMTLVLVFFLVTMIGATSAMSGRDGSGGGGGGINILEMMISQYYSMVAAIIPMIYIILTANKLIAAQVDKGSLGYVMANPIKRNQVSITQAIFLIASLTAMFTAVTVSGLILIAAMSIEIEIGAFILLNLGVLLLLLAIAGISYLASCIFNLSRHSLAVGAGIPIAFFLFNMLAGFSEMGIDALQYFKYFTINTLFSVSDVLAYSTNMIWQFPILALIAVGCFVGGVAYFKKKDLPL